MTERTTPTESLVERLHEIASWVSSSQDLEKLLELVLETAAGILNAKAGSILLLNRRTKKLVFKAATGEKKQEVKSFTINLGQGIAGHVAETGKPLLISNVTKDPLWDSSISHSLRLDTQSIACVPMQIDGRIIGVLEVIDKTDGRPLTENDLRDLFGLLVLAHYRTTPFDLRQLLDGPNLDLFVLRYRGRILATALVAREGGFDTQMAHAIWSGDRRPRGHLLAQSLARILDVPFAMGDATVLTEAGYVGEYVENILLRLIQAADYDIARAEKVIKAHAAAKATGLPALADDARAPSPIDRFVQARLAAPDITGFTFEAPGFLARRGWLDPADYTQTARQYFMKVQYLFQI